MTKNEMISKIEEIKHAARLQMRDVYSEYVKSNAKYKIGDIVCDSTDTIRVEIVTFSLLGGDISIYYRGPLLTKKGNPRKDGTKRAIFEDNIKNKVADADRD